jgi:putative tryptophan/tyrosine transport system substrate-binding protein
MLDMKRREFIALVGGGGLLLVAKVRRARGQQPAMPVIGYLSGGSARELASLVAAFHRGLNETVYFEGRNVAVEYRWANGRYDELPALAADLVRRQGTVIAALGSAAPGLAAKAATLVIPIVFQTGSDPVQDGLVTSMNRLGGNITGVSRWSVTLWVETA